MEKGGIDISLGETEAGVYAQGGEAYKVEGQAQEFQKRTGIKCEVVIDPKDIVADIALNNY